MLYTVLVTRRMRTQSAYSPVFEDWLFHSLLPAFSYLALLALAFAAQARTGEVLFGVAGALLLLLFTAIHNAWDAVFHYVLVHLRKPKE